MIQTKDFLSMENIDLMAEMGVAQPLDTPLTTLLMGRGQTDKETAPLVYFREKTLDTTEDISQVEGSETTEFQASTRLPKNNYCEIFKKAVSVSGTAQASSVTGIADMYTSEMADRLVELKVNLEKALTNGVKNDGSATP
ncbi:SU10 major capsid protein, partial [Clostridium tyrobutyricum]